VIKKIKEFIKENIDSFKFGGAVIGISGGIDSAVAGKLLVEALGRDKVFGLLLPERDSSPQTVKDSKFVCNYLNIDYKIIKITPMLRRLGIYKLKPPAFWAPRALQNRYSRGVWEKDAERGYLSDLSTEGSVKFLESLAYYRTKHRIRMCTLYFEAEKRGWAVVGTTNKTEYLTGFYTKWGDDSNDMEPIQHLYKTEVYEMAKKLGIPELIINKKPSPDIAPGITDEYAMGLTYDDLDRILIKIEREEDLSLENDIQVKKVKEILANVKYRNVRNLQL